MNKTKAQQLKNLIDSTIVLILDDETNRIGGNIIGILTYYAPLDAYHVLHNYTDDSPYIKFSLDVVDSIVHNTVYISWTNLFATAGG